MQVTLTAKWTGSDFRAWREDLRLTQAEAARLLGVSRRSVVAWEADGAGKIAASVVLACGFITAHQAEIGPVLRRSNANRSAP